MALEHSTVTLWPLGPFLSMWVIQRLAWGIAMLKNAVNIKHWNDCSVISELEESSELQLFGARYRLIYIINGTNNIVYN